ncbi:MAG: hypothetical protein Q4B94_07005 [Pseudomonadota bacterium]|nr:hypothetical protein [Pseudomonadota bacterium]
MLAQASDKRASRRRKILIIEHHQINLIALANACSKSFLSSRKCNHWVAPQRQHLLLLQMLAGPPARLHFTPCICRLCKATDAKNAFGQALRYHFRCNAPTLAHGRHYNCRPEKSSPTGSNSLKSLFFVAASLLRLFP